MEILIGLVIGLVSFVFYIIATSIKKNGQMDKMIHEASRAQTDIKKMVEDENIDDLILNANDKLRERRKR